MGIFDAIKKFVDNTDSAYEQIDELRELNIKELLNDDEIISNPVLKNIINLNRNYTCFSFGKINSVYESFQIYDKTEKVILFMEGKRGIVGNATIRFLLTNKAMYFPIELAKNLNTGEKVVNRIPLEEVSKYIVLMDETNGKIQLANEQKKIILYEKSLLKSRLSYNSDISLLNQLLRNIQTDLVKYYESAKFDRSNLFRWLNSYIKSNIKENGLSPYIESLLFSMREEVAYKNLCDLVLLKAYIYTRNHTGFYLILRQVEISNVQQERQFLDKFLEIVKTYVNDVSDPTVYFGQSCLEVKDVYADDRFFIESEYEEFSSVQKEIIEIYDANAILINYSLAFRTQPQISYSELLTSFKWKKLALDWQENILNLYAYWRNETFRKLTKKILLNNSITKAECELRDGYGLTALHYAFILHQDSVIDDLLEKTNIEEDISNTGNPFALIRMYGIAAILTENEKYLEKIVCNSKELIALFESRKEIKQKIQKKQIALEAEKIAVRQGEQQLKNMLGNVDEETINRQRKKIASVKGSICNLKNSIEILECQLKENGCEIISTKDLLINQYYVYVSKIKKSTDSVFRLYTQIYSIQQLPENYYDNNNFYCVSVSNELLYINFALISKEELEKYIRKNTDYFPNGVERITVDIIDDSFDETIHDTMDFDSEAKDTETLCYEKPYGDNWFSPEAYHNIVQMKKEYRELVLKFHPDNNPNYTEAFKSIQNEKVKIINAFK